MGAPLPDTAQIRQAIDVYLRTAYPGGFSERVKAQLATLDACSGNLVEQAPFVHDPQPSPTRYFLRLGNPSYPHMKLAVELPPNGNHFLYRVDTHDRHCCPKPSSSEYGQFCELMESNRKIAERIEAAWEGKGLPTFKAFLREDLKRRKAAIAPH